jgi:hypothetical protein
MTNALPPTPAWTIGSILEQSYRLARDNFAAFITVTLVFAAAALVADLLSLGLLAGIVHLATGAATTICLTWGTLKALGGEPPAWEPMLRQVQGPRFWMFLLLGVVLYLAIGLSAILVIPPFILLPLWSVAIPAMMVEKGDIGAAFARSVDLTRDRRLRILGVFVAAALAVALGGWVVVALFGFGAVGNLVMVIYGAVVSTFLHPLSGILYTHLLAEKHGVMPDRVAAALD